MGICSQKPGRRRYSYVVKANRGLAEALQVSFNKKNSDRPTSHSPQLRYRGRNQTICMLTKVARKSFVWRKSQRMYRNCAQVHQHVTSGSTGGLGTKSACLALTQEMQRVIIGIQLCPDSVLNQQLCISKSDGEILGERRSTSAPMGDYRPEEWLGVCACRSRNPPLLMVPPAGLAGVILCPHETELLPLAWISKRSCKVLPTMRFVTAR